MIKYYIACSLFAFQAYTYTDVATSKAMIISILRQKNPDLLHEFTQFFKKYDHSVVMFFDRNNNDSLEAHIMRMEGEVQELDAVIADQRFISIRPLLKEQREHLVDLLAVLRSYIGSDKALSLAFKVRKFKFLLPLEVKKRGNIALYKALRHRLAM